MTPIDMVYKSGQSKNNDIWLKGAFFRECFFGKDCVCNFLKSVNRRY